MRRCKYLIFPLIVTLSTGLSLHAKESSDEATNPVGVMPSRGMTPQQVETYFGAPLEKLPAVGNPPIIRWVYDGFVLYWEGGYVIHAFVPPEE